MPPAVPGTAARGADTTPASPGPLHADRILELARRHLELEVSYLTAFEDGHQVIKAVSGDSASFDLTIGTSTPMADGYCAQMILGDIPNVVTDARNDDRVNSLAVTAQFGIGSYIGVPLTIGDGEVYGSFCCVSHDPQPHLGPRDVRFLNMLAELLVEELDAQHERDRLRAQVQQLLDVGHVDIALQPIVDIRSGRCAGVEALSRFPAGFGAPDAVFAAAHAVGLGLELEVLAVRNAFGLLPTLHEHMYLGLNLAPEIAMDITGALPKELDVPWRRVVLEITEHAAVADYAELRAGLAPLRKKGLRVAVDDAGAGYASMQHVVEMRPDIIKVDRSLIDGLARDPARRGVVSAFVLLAFELGATVLAEGVETSEDLEAARRLGATAAQGYVIARPSVDPADHRRWGSSHNLLPENLSG